MEGLPACLSHVDLLSQNDERGRYSVMGQFPDQLRCNKQISNGPRGQGRAHRAVVMIWTDERGAPAAAARRRFAMSGEVGAVMPCSLNRALVKHAACGGRGRGRGAAPPDDKWRTIKLSLSPLIRSRSPI